MISQLVKHASMDRINHSDVLSETQDVQLVRSIAVISVANE